MHRRLPYNRAGVRALSPDSTDSADSADTPEAPILKPAILRPQTNVDIPVSDLYGR